MGIEFRQPERPAPRGERVMHFLVGLLHLALVGMVIYLRAGPVHRVIRQAEARGVLVPRWIPLTFTAATLILAVFLGIRSLTAFRRASRSGPGA